MFGSKGFSNSLGDDILNSFIQDTAKKTQTHKPNTLSAAEEKHLLATKKLVEQLAEEEESVSKNNQTAGPMFGLGLARSSVSKKKPTDEKVVDDVDELLNLIDDVKYDKSPAKKSAEPSKINKSPPKEPKISVGKPVESNKFAEELMEEDIELPAYDPTIRESRNNKRTNSAPSDEQSKKRSTLFGLANSTVSNVTKSQASETQNSQVGEKPQQRPQTTEAKTETKTTKDNDDEIGEINIGFSRRKSKLNSAAKERPSTTPEESKIVKDNKPSLFLEKTPSSNKPVQNVDDSEEAENEYLSAVFGRRDNNKDKKVGPTILKLGGDSHKGSPSKMGTTTITADTSITPVKSPRSDFVTSKEGFFLNKEGTFSQMVDKKEESSLPRNPVSILGKKDLTEPHQHQLGRSLSMNTSNMGVPMVRKERIDANGVRYENLQSSGVSGIGWEGSIRDGVGGLGDFGKEGGLQGYLKETEEYYKKRARESEEYYENRYKQLKKAMEEEKAKWDQVHEKELELLKKENVDLKEHMNKHLERERERIQEIFTLEMQSKEKIHEYELQRQRRQFEEENDFLRKQLEAQSKLNHLADEIKYSSSKLVSLSDKIEQGGSGGTLGRKGELREKEKQLEELERQLRHEMEMVHSERNRLDKLRMDIDNRNSEEKEMINKEKELLRNEYARLNQLQESVRRQELEKARNLEKEKAKYEHERSQLEKESFRLKQEYSQKYHEMELQLELQNIKKQEFDKVINQTEASFLRKQEEIETTMRRLTGLEMDLMRRVKEVEHKEMLINKKSEEVERRLQILELERITYEKERSQMIKMLEKAQEDVETLRRFKKEYENEQQNNLRLKGEFAAFTLNLQNERTQLAEEKNNVAMMHKTLETLKHDYVKEINVGQQKPLLDRPIAHIRERSQDSVLGKTPMFSVVATGSTRNSPMRGTVGQENNLMNTERPNTSSVISQDPPMVKLKDLKKERHAGRDLSVTKERGTWDLSKLFRNSITGDDIKSWTRGTPSVVAPTKTENEVIGREKFDFNNYMAKLRQMDQTSNINQSYIDMEREDLLKDKIEVGLGFSPARYDTSGARVRHKRSSVRHF